MTTYSIYTLSDPDTKEVRYVGKARDIGARFLGHIRESLNTDGSKARWFRGILETGKLPIIDIIETAEDSEVGERERFWIKKYANEGCDLVNKKSNPNWANPGPGRKTPGQQSAYWLPESSLYQILDLADKSGEHQTQVLVRAVERLWMMEIGDPLIKRKRGKMSDPKSGPAPTDEDLDEAERADNIEPNESDDTQFSDYNPQTDEDE